MTFFVKDGLRKGDVDPHPVYLTNGKIRIYHRKSFNQPGIAYTDGDGLTFDTTTTRTIVPDGAGQTSGKYDPAVIKFPNGKIMCYIGADFKINQNIFSKIIGAISKPVNSVRKIINPEDIQYILYQNYPNPFNPSTTIEFYIPGQENINLTVYDALGKEVAVLVNSNLPGGNHKIEFNGKRLSSGIYIYTLKAGNTLIEKRMQLIK